MSWRHELFPTITAQELTSLCLGAELGEGGFRRVLVWMPDADNVVAKIETCTAQFANAFEWHMWHRAVGTPLEQWLAPCLDISDNGVVLLQKRTYPVPAGKFPKRIPAVLKDIKRSNFGMIGKRVVCHDYGLVEYREAPTEKLVMTKADW